MHAVTWSVDQINWVPFPEEQILRLLIPRFYYRIIKLAYCVSLNWTSESQFQGMSATSWIPNVWPMFLISEFVLNFTRRALTKGSRWHMERPGRTFDSSSFRHKPDFNGNSPVASSPLVRYVSSPFRERDSLQIACLCSKSSICYLCPQCQVWNIIVKLEVRYDLLFDPKKERFDDPWLARVGWPSGSKVYVTL